MAKEVRAGARFPRDPTKNMPFPGNAGPEFNPEMGLDNFLFIKSTPTIPPFLIRISNSQNDLLVLWTSSIEFFPHEITWEILIDIESKLLKSNIRKNIHA